MLEDFTDDNGIRREPDGKFKKGYSANPDGASIVYKQAKKLRDMVAKDIEDFYERAKYIALYENGSTSSHMIQELFSRYEGRPGQRLEIEMKEGMDATNFSREQLAAILHTERKRMGLAKDE